MGRQRAGAPTTTARAGRARMRAALPRAVSKREQARQGGQDAPPPARERRGYQLRIKGEGSNPSVLPTEPTGDRPTLQAALDAGKDPGKLSDRSPREHHLPAQVAKDSKGRRTPPPDGEDQSLGPTQTSIALGAFGYALLFFVLAGTGAGCRRHACAQAPRARDEAAGARYAPVRVPDRALPVRPLPAGVAYKMGAWLKSPHRGRGARRRRLGGVGHWHGGAPRGPLIGRSRSASSASSLRSSCSGLWGGTKQPPRAAERSEPSGGACLDEAISGRSRSIRCDQRVRRTEEVHTRRRPLRVRDDAVHMLAASHYLDRETARGSSEDRPSPRRCLRLPEAMIAAFR